MAVINKNGKFFEGTNLSKSEFQDFKDIYEKALHLSYLLTFYIMNKFGSLLELQDLTLIDSMLPTEANYKTWDYDKFKKDIEELKYHFEARGELFKKFNAVKADPDEVIRQSKHELFPFYQEFKKDITY
ncbi:MAG: hypothetical protein ABSG15_13220 [FCB group bacterium]|jgi:hypothetical protein